MKAITAKELVPPLNGKEPRHKDPNLEDIDRIVVTAIMASQTSDPWVLVDRSAFLRHGQSSKVYIALRRRGFDVVVRHVDGVKNYWCCWPHELPTMPELPMYDDDDGMFGALM
jgi:hypothetical protein